jgi:hypothetical protein
MAAPTKAELAKKRMEEIDTILRSKIPSILQSGLKRMEELVQDTDTAPAVVTRIVEYATKELKDLKEADLEKVNTTDSKGTKEFEDEEIPLISLHAVN